MIKFIALIGLIFVISAYADKKTDKKEDVGTVIGIDLGTTYSWYALIMKQFKLKKTVFVFKMFLFFLVLVSLKTVVLR